MENNNIITESERKTIISEMEDLLSEYGYQYTERALSKIIDTWAEQKADLISHFKKHPNYVKGKFMIAFDVDYERTVDEIEICNFVRWLSNTCFFRTDLLSAEIDVQRKSENCTYLPQTIFNFIKRKIEELKSRTISDETAEYINEVMPWAHAHAGQKTSRVINKIMTYIGYAKHPEYNREFAKYADALSPLVIKRHTVVSLNPLDYLTMSFGNSWASCHTIDKANKRGMPNSYEGQYSSGTISYMLDPTSMVLYTVSADYNGNEYYTQPKINRQMFHWGEDKLLQGRLYPQDNDGNGEAYTPYRNIVQKVISECYDFPNLWSIKKGTVYDDIVESYGTHYRDYECYSNCTLSRPKGKEKNTNPMEIGADPICIECGWTHSEEECINCCRNPSIYYCADCGDAINDEDDVIWINDRPYCRDCVEYCAECDEYHRNESYYIDSEDIYVCEYCYSEYFEECNECGENHRRSEIYYVESEDAYVCESCYYDNYFTCDECGEVHNNREMHNHSGIRYLCEDCHTDCIESETKNEEDEEAI